MTTSGRSAMGIVSPKSGGIILPEADPKIVQGSTLRAQHPVAADDYVLPTEEMYALSDYMLDAIRLGLDGAIVYGSSFAGKSFAVSQVAKWFEAENTNDFLTLKITVDGDKKLLNNFTRYISHKLGYLPNAKTANNNRVADNLISSLIYNASKHGNKIVLILDEAEYLTLDHYHVLKSHYNSLQDNGVKLITFLVGTETLLNTRKLFEKSGSSGTQISRRLMMGDHQFHAITDEESLRYALAGYDKLAYSGETFTQHYFPEAWAKGVRMADLAEDMTAVMKEISGISVLPEFPMGYFTKVAKALLLYFGKDSSSMNLSGGSMTKEWINIEDITKVMYRLGIEKKLIELSAQKIITGKMIASRNLEA